MDLTKKAVTYLSWAIEVNGLSREVDLDSVACSPKFHVRFDDLECCESHVCLKTRFPIRPGQNMGTGPAKGAEMTSKWAHQGAPRISKCVPLGYLFNQLLTKSGVREECARCCRFSTISIDFMDSPTLNPLAAAQSKHRFSFLGICSRKAS